MDSSTQNSKWVSFVFSFLLWITWRWYSQNRGSSFEAFLGIQDFPRRWKGCYLDDGGNHVSRNKRSWRKQIPASSSCYSTRQSSGLNLQRPDWLNLVTYSTSRKSWELRFFLNVEAFSQKSIQRGVRHPDSWSSSSSSSRWHHHMCSVCQTSGILVSFFGMVSRFRKEKTRMTWFLGSAVDRASRNCQSTLLG